MANQGDIFELFDNSDDEELHLPIVVPPLLFVHPPEERNRKYKILQNQFSTDLSIS